MERLDEIGYLAAENNQPQLKNELTNIRAEYSNLIFAKKPLQNTFWMQNIWLDPFQFSISSIGDGVKKLKSLGKYWTLHPHVFHRRAALIQQQLPAVHRHPLHFPATLPKTVLGSWMLLDEHTIIASPQTSSPFCAGIPDFEEIKQGPPGRAYLKLWEALTLLGKHPQPGESCLELGASPGGWTWVLASLGCNVTAVDRSPLAPHLMKNSRIHFIKGNAFSLKPESIGPVDWLFCDVICYPEKLYEWLQPWILGNFCKNFVCTLKFQGDSHYETIKAFAEIPGSTLRHLYHNKHELTWTNIVRP